MDFFARPICAAQRYDGFERALSMWSLVRVAAARGARAPSSSRRAAPRHGIRSSIESAGMPLGARRPGPPAAVQH